MPRPSPNAEAGFTIFELCIAIAIAMLIISVAIPSLSGVMKETKGKDAFADFDKLVQEAHSRSLSEQRAYVLIQSPKALVVRPDTPANAGEAEGIDRMEFPKGEVLSLFFAPPLTKQREATPEAIWTFWPSGACEPATVTYKGSRGKWSAVYNPFTVQAVVQYE